MTAMTRLSRSPTYKSWMKMKERCTNPNAMQWKWYGGRGIKVCDRWRTFSSFLEDMGPRPSLDYTIDRIDSDGDYEPGNCRWATRAEQINNQKKTIWVVINGEPMTLRDACRQRGIKFSTAYDRMSRGHSVEYALQARDLRFRAPMEKPLWSVA